MMLPSPHNTRYRSYYRRIGRGTLHYTILDNGAWEQNALNAGDLISLAWRYRIHEIVAPDILNDADGTYDAMKLFFRTYKDFKVAAPSYNPKFMAVAHGKSITEACRFIEKVADDFPQVTVIAAGRAFSRNVQDRRARATLAVWTHEHFADRFEFHLLGHNDAWPEEVPTCKNIVRSLDTVLPFSAAFYDLHYNLVGTHNTPRPLNYFDLAEDAFDLGLVEANIAALLEAAT